MPKERDDWGYKPRREATLGSILGASVILLCTTILVNRGADGFDVFFPAVLGLFIATPGGGIAGWTAAKYLHEVCDMRELLRMRRIVVWGLATGAAVAAITVAFELRIPPHME